MIQAKPWRSGAARPLVTMERAPRGRTWSASSCWPGKTGTGISSSVLKVSGVLFEQGKRWRSGAARRPATRARALLHRTWSACFCWRGKTGTDRLSGCCPCRNLCLHRRLPQSAHFPSSAENQCTKMMADFEGRLGALCTLYACCCCGFAERHRSCTMWVNSASFMPYPSQC